MTFKAAYCTTHACPPEHFGSRVFRKVIHRRAMPAAIVLRTLNPDFFQADFELIQAAGEATDARQLEEHLQDYRLDSRNLRWARRCAFLRISTRRLRRLARKTWAQAGTG
ncbi:MAG TPA: hypothetical protein VGE76_23895 [Opitutaceae bacterium]